MPEQNTYVFVGTDGKERRFVGERPPSKQEMLDLENREKGVKPILGYQGITKSVLPRASASLDTLKNTPSSQAPLPNDPTSMAAMRANPLASLATFLRRSASDPTGGVKRLAGNVGGEVLDATTSPLSLLLSGAGLVGRELPINEVAGPVADALQKYDITKPTKPLGDALKALANRRTAQSQAAGDIAQVRNTPSPAAPEAAGAPSASASAPGPTPAPPRSTGAASTVPSGFPTPKANGVPDMPAVLNQARNEGFDRAMAKQGMGQNSEAAHTPGSAIVKPKLSAAEFAAKQREVAGTTPRSDTGVSLAGSPNANAEQMKRLAPDVGGKGGARPLRAAAADAINEKVDSATQYAGLSRVAKWAQDNPTFRPGDLVSGPAARKKLLDALATYNAQE